MDGLAAMPVLCKQIEEDSLLRMLCDDILVQLHAKPGSLREREVPIYDFGIPWCSGFHPILCEVVEVLLDFEIGRGGRKVKGCSRRNGSSHIVGCDLHIVCLGPGSKLLRFKKAAEVGN